MRAVAGREATRTTNDAIKGCGPYGTPTRARAPVGCLHTSFLEKTLQLGVSGASRVLTHTFLPEQVLPTAHTGRGARRGVCAAARRAPKPTVGRGVSFGVR